MTFSTSKIAQIRRDVSTTATRKQENNSKKETAPPLAEISLKIILKDKNRNNRVIVASTCMGFYEIKKKNLNKALGIKTLGQKVAFPKFFMNTDGYFNQGLQKFTET